MVDDKGILVVGAGLSGAVIARKYAEAGNKVTIIDKRTHIAGNCYDYVDEHNIMRSLYGAHIFHTSHEDVWEFVNRFTEFNDYQHSVKSSVEGKIVPVPANLDTYNEILNEDFDEDSLKEFIESSQWAKTKKPKNSEEAALKRLGSQKIYNKMFYFYTYKQWDMYPKDLEPEVLERIPVRFDHNQRYFNDPHEGIPKYGYTKMVQDMLIHENITILLHTDYFSPLFNKEGFSKTFFTGPIDSFFGLKYGALQYRSIKLEDEVVETDSYQDSSVVNYPLEHIYTRIVEHKKLYGRGDEGWTIITKEYPVWHGEPYYPVPTKKNRALYEKYRQLAEESSDIIFVGRLASYKYFNMDQAIKNSLDLFNQLEGAK